MMVPNPIKMDDLGVPLFLETPNSTSANIEEVSLLRRNARKRAAEV